MKPENPASPAATMPLAIGDPAPWFLVPSLANVSEHMNTIIGGYRTVLCFFGSFQNPLVKPVLQQLGQMQRQLAQMGVTLFGVSVDQRDAQFQPPIEEPEFFKLLWDFAGELSIRYGMCQLDPSGQVAYDPTTIVLDENLRVLAVIPLETHINHVDRLFHVLQSFPTPPANFIPQQAPVLLVPRVFSPEFCQSLIDRYEQDGGTESGFMKQEGDQTIVVLDPQVKRRRDVLITDAALMGQINALIWRRIRPEIEKAFQYRITNFERYTIACYESTNQGFFQPHRDNTSLGNAHRRFAMTLNLNADYEGGYLKFPEYSADRYRPEVGGAIIFSCSLLHEATPVTQGRRFALLSFFYGDTEAKLREQTQKKIVRQS